MIACVILLINANYNNKNNGSSNRNGNEKWKWWRGHQKWHKWNLHPNLNEEHFISINFIRKSNLIDCVFKMGGLKIFKYFERWLICLATFISMQISIYLKYNRKFWDVLTLDWRRVCVCVCYLYWDCKNQLLSTCKSLQALKWAWFFFHSISNICHVIDLLASIWLYWKFIEPIPCFSNGFKYILHTKKQSLAQLINDKCVHVHSQPEREGERKRTNKKTRGGNSMRKC